MTDLTDRMRTCAAHIVTTCGEHDPEKWLIVFLDAADLLIEASNALEAIPPPLGEPMALLEPVVPKPASKPPPDLPPNPVPRAVWTTNAGDLPAITGQPSKRAPRVCPQCDSRAVKKVYREGSRLMLACPVCSAGWEYKP